MVMTEKVFQASLGNIHYWVGGPGEGAPWLVFLPGLTADHHLFDKQTEAFASRFNCLVWDAPAHGESRPFALEFSMDDLADYLHAILEREEAEKPVLVGQSLGGYISQVYMERYPSRVRLCVHRLLLHEAEILHCRRAAPAQAHGMDVPVHPLEAVDPMGS